MGKVVPTPESLPDPGDVKLDHKESQEKYTWPHEDVNAEIRTGKDTCYGESAVTDSAWKLTL